MRGRKSSKRPRKNSGTSSGKSKEVVDADLNPDNDESNKQDDPSTQEGISSKKSSHEGIPSKKSSHEGIPCEPEENDEVGNLKSSFVQEEDTEDTIWEDGFVSISGNKTGNTFQTEREVSHVTVEFTESPSSSAKRKVARRASAEDKELAEWAHKVHLLCLLARGRLVDEACDDPLIQASLLSLLPAPLLKITELPKLSARALEPLVSWFQSNFRIQNLGPTEGPLKSSLRRALETQAGSAEEMAALSVALFRGLNLTARFVSILDVISLKPDISTSGSSSHDDISLELQNRLSTTIPILSSQRANVNGNNVCEKQMTGSQAPNSSTYENKDLSETRENSGAKSTEKMKRKGDIEFELQLAMALAATASGVTKDGAVSNVQESNCSSSFALLNKRKRAKAETDSGSAFQGNSGASWSRKVGPPLYWAEVFCGGEAITGRWVHVDAANSIIDGEQKVELAAAACKRHLRYVIAFVGRGAKDVTRRLLSLCERMGLDGYQAATLRRYCMKWYTIAPYRINSSWWEAVLAPLKELESGLRGGRSRLEGCIEKALTEIDKGQTVELHGHLQICSNEVDESLQQSINFASRSALEDVELETRALTEPLPTNQQAYRNHHLYSLERWLTKYQILHPKGPVLGFCSGHPVYPRSCVQNLQSKHRWLREGLQIKANEKPAKVVKHSRKFIKGKKFESNDSDDNDEDGGGGSSSTNEGVIELYGKWQMEPLNLPRAVDGIVPKNEWGRVDVWSEKCLPPGTVHLRFPRLVTIAQRLQINFAPAMVGFEFKNGRSFPVYDGIVVCSEFKDAIMEAYAEAEEIRIFEEKKRQEAQVISRWYQLLSSMVTRQRLKNSYEVTPGSATLSKVEQKEDLGRGTARNAAGSEKAQTSTYQQPVQDLDSGLGCSSLLGDHEHLFPIENQSFDEENLIRTKRCPCGFSIRVEEM